MKEYLETLDKVLPVVVRVHGKEHPELHDVATQYAILKEKLEKNEEIKDTIEELRKITSNYTLPEDACQAYTKVYHSLQAIDQGL